MYLQKEKAYCCFVRVQTAISTVEISVAAHQSLYVAIYPR